jgi:Uma2 family endonuclease
MSTFLMRRAMVVHAIGNPIRRNRRMQMALKERQWTRADLDHLPDDGNRYEVIDGILFVTPPPSPAHASILVSLMTALRPYVGAHGLGEIFDSRVGVVLGESQTEPDLIVSQRPVPPPERWEDMPRPLLIVEVLSPTTARRDQTWKRALYMRERVDEYWIVDGGGRTVTVITPSGERTERAMLRWQPRECPAPLEIDLPALFANALGREGHRE